MTPSRIDFWRGVCGCTVGSWSAVAAIVYCAIAPLPAAALWARGRECRHRARRRNRRQTPRAGHRARRTRVLRIVEIIRVIVMVLIQVTRWVVEAIVCLVERFCAYLYFLAGVALIAVFVGGVMSAGAVLIPGGFVVLAAGAIAAPARPLLRLHYANRVYAACSA